MSREPSDLPPTTKGPAAASELSRLVELRKATIAFLDAAASVGQTGDHETFLERLLAEALRAAGTVNGAAVILEGEAGSEVANIVVALEQGRVLSEAEKVSRGLGRIPFDAGLRAFAERVARCDDGAPTAADDASLPASVQQCTREQGVKMVYTIAMRVGGRQIGWLGIGYTSHEPRSADQLALHRLLADHMAAVLELTRLHELAKQTALVQERAHIAVKRAERLTHINSALKRSIDIMAEPPALEEMLRHTLRAICAQFGCQEGSGALLLCDPPQTELRRHLIYLNGELIAGAALEERGSKYEPLNPLLFRAEQPRRGPFLLKFDEMPPDRKEFLRRNGVADSAIFPMYSSDRLVGVFVVSLPTKRPDPSDEDIQLGQTLIHQATLAMQLERVARIGREESRQAATLAERERIARELHDSLAQGLTGILMRLHASVRAADASAAQKHVMAALDVARGALVDARRAVHALRSLSNERIPFSAALKGVLKTTFAGSAIALEISDTVVEGAFPLSEQVENDLMHIAQETATNVLKHAGATRFDVRIEALEDRFRLILSDDGVGFSEDSRADGFGLRGMRERAQRIAAQLDVSSAPNSGTCVSVTVTLTGSQTEI